MRLIPDKSVDMIFTDPPYGHNNNNGDLIERWEAALGRPAKKEAKARPIANDGKEAIEVFEKMLVQAARVLKPGGVCCCCCCGGGGPDPQYARWSLLVDKHLEFVQMVVWDKGKIGMGWRYRRSYETVLVGYRKGAPMAWYDDSHKVENIIRPGDYGIRKIIPSARQHPTEKPVELAKHFIRLHTKPGDLVLDPFAGGGSTLLAADALDRNAVGYDLSEDFIAMYAKKKLNMMEQMCLTSK